MFYHLHTFRPNPPVASLLSASDNHPYLKTEEKHVYQTKHLMFGDTTDL